MATLTIFNEEGEAKEIHVQKEVVTIGRLPDNDIEIPDKRVSARHLKLTFSGNEWTLEDLDSTNGTFVNGEFVKGKKLKEGDEIVIGKTKILFGKRTSPECPEEEFSSIAKFTDRPSAVIDTVIPEPPSTIISPPSVIASHEELKKAHRTLAILYEAGGLLNSVFKVEEVLDKIMDLIFQYLRADRALIMLKEESTSKTTSSGVRLIPKAVRKRDKTDKTELTVSHSIINQVLKEGKSVICSDALEDERFKAKQSIIQYHIHSAMCVPLLTKEKTLGVIYADTLLSKGAFGAEDLKLLSAIGNEAALAIDNARLYEENLKAARLAGIGQAITGMAHYIKNILVGIEGGSTLMDMGIEQKNDTLVNKGWKLVKSATGKVRDLVMDMLTYSKEKEPQLVPCNLNDIVEDVVHLMSEKGEELGIKVNTSLDRDIGQFQLDPQIIHRALLNLINNAFDAMKDGGEVTITTEYRTVYPQEVGGEKGDQLKLSVTDTGPGIPDEVVKTLFTPFHTTTKGLGGTGLGLAVTHKIIKEHGGTIEVESKVGKGTTFHIYLPAKKE